VWGPAKFYFLRDSAQKGLQRLPATHNSAASTPMLPSFPQIHTSHYSLHNHVSSLTFTFSMHIVQCNEASGEFYVAVGI
jgi:hypothetical protein